VCPRGGEAGARNLLPWESACGVWLPTETTGGEGEVDLYLGPEGGLLQPTGEHHPGSAELSVERLFPPWGRTQRPCRARAGWRGTCRGSTPPRQEAGSAGGRTVVQVVEGRRPAPPQHISAMLAGQQGPVSTEGLEVAVADAEGQKSAVEPRCE